MVDTAADARRYLDPHTLAAIGSLELRARMLVEGMMIGQHRSPYRGFSTEFAEHRAYAPGDDLRHLDWKVYGRTDKLYLKQYQKETNLRLVLLVDVSGSMDYCSGHVAGWRKYDLAATVAAALANLALHHQDRVRLVLFGSDLLRETALSNARDHWRSIVGMLMSVAELAPESPAGACGPRTDLGRLFDQLGARLRHRSLVALISDLFDDPEVIERGVARLYHGRHDVILLQTLDHAELHFPFRAPSEFLGLEAEGRLSLDPMALRRAYLEALREHQARIEAAARRFRFDYVQLDSSRPLAGALSQFLARRAAMIGKGR